METTLIGCTATICLVIFVCVVMHHVVIRRDLEGMRSTMEIDALSRSINIPRPDPGRAQALKEKLADIERRIERLEARQSGL